MAYVVEGLPTFVIWNLKFKICCVPVAHACKPSYSGGRDQEYGLKPAQENSLWDPISKMPSSKKSVGGAGRVAQIVGPEFKPQYHTHTHTHTN
jgi:hypothetical protein